MHPSIVDTSIIDLLEADPRPSFIVALAPHPPTVVYTNRAFAGYPELLELITTRRDDSQHLWEWITGFPSSSAPQEPATTGSVTCSSFSYSNVYWTRSVVHEQMVVVGANEQRSSSEMPARLPPDAEARRSSSVPSPRRILPIDGDVAGLASGPSSPCPPSPVSDRRAKSNPAVPAVPVVTLATNPRERPPSRTEAVQSLEPIGRSVSDPGWILPDTKPGKWLCLRSQQAPPSGWPHCTTEMLTGRIKSYVPSWM
jgi:hypothetical protein